jgi:thiamine-phosphate pyrophosphorylase
LRCLTECRLYGILDLGYVEARDALRIAGAMIAGGVDLIQLRGKQQSIDQLTDLARELHRLTSSAGTPLIANDYAELADRVPLEGVHVGQDDLSIAAVRASVGRRILVGKSTHSPAQADAAQREGADYIGFGPLFATPTKPDYTPIGLRDIAQVHRDVRCPIFCIGGIKLQNLEQVIAAGARRVVIVSGLLQARDIAQYAREAGQLLAKSKIENPKSTI